MHLTVFVLFVVLGGEGSWRCGRRGGGALGPWVAVGSRWWLAGASKAWPCALLLPTSITPKSCAVRDFESSLVVVVVVVGWGQHTTRIHA